MDYEKNPNAMPGLLKLNADHSVVWALFSWTPHYGTSSLAPALKSLGPRASHSLARKGAGLRLHNNFFKTHDDCLKAFFPDRIFTDNIVWHSDVGRAVLLSWGSCVVGGNMANYQDIFYFESIITPPLFMANRHTQRSGTQKKKTLFKSWPSTNSRATSVVPTMHLPTVLRGQTIQIVFAEGDVGVAIQLSTGYYNVNNRAKWMQYSTRLGGFSGDIHVELKGLDMSRTLRDRGNNIGLSGR